MRIPPDAVIADRKLYNYLLGPLPKNDKNKFLAQGRLRCQHRSSAVCRAIRNLADTTDATRGRDHEVREQVARFWYN